MTTRDRIPVRDDLAETQPYGAPQLDVPVRLNTNETPWAPPQAFTDTLAERVRELGLHRYPDRRAWRLRTTLGARYGLPPERVWAANGSNEVLQQLFQAYGGPQRRLLLFRPGYSMHRLIAQVALTDVVEVGLPDGFVLDPDTARDAVAQHDPDLICVASPNNPTGIPVTAEAVRALHEDSRALVVLDEAYAEFAEETFDRANVGGDLDGPAPVTTGVALLDELPRLAVVRTFSKALRLAGVRLGYLLAGDWLVDDLRRVRLPYHLDALAQEAGLVALELGEQMSAHIPAIVAERERVREALERHEDMHVWPSAANFLLFRLAGRAGAEVFERLLDQGVLVRDFSRTLGLEGCLRVTIGTPEENEAFLDALDAVVKEP